MWKASPQPIQSLLGAGVCHKKHQGRAPVVPAFCSTLGLQFQLLLFSSPDVFLPSASFSVHSSVDYCFSCTQVELPSFD